MKVVIDNNIVVSAVLKDKDPEEAILYVDRDFDQPLKILNTAILSVRQFKKLVMMS